MRTFPRPCQEIICFHPVWQAQKKKRKGKNEQFKSRNDDEMYDGGDYSKRIKSFASMSNINSMSELQENPTIVSSLFDAFDKFVNIDE